MFFIIAFIRLLKKVELNLNKNATFLINLIILFICYLPNKQLYRYFKNANSKKNITLLKLNKRKVRLIKEKKLVLVKIKKKFLVWQVFILDNINIIQKKINNSIFQKK